jgi:conjugative transfer signal peptidase TraF
MTEDRPDAPSARRVSLLMGALAIAALISGSRRPLIVFNATASAPIGFYRVHPPAPLRLGALVLVETPQSVRALAAARGYLPASAPLVKRVAARSGTTVCAHDGAIAIDGRRVAVQKKTDGRGRRLPLWLGCRRLAADEIFLLMADVPDSFDSRYFGPVRTSAVIGRLSPLWLH